ncbi:MAG: hypothetical protein BGP09_21550 [Rhizobium sp. 60-20]|jgi:hypothetical protein|nr:MAG: hypothetical protein BGP09_21550 [Rhizobium sp. 60-20]RKD35793.1 hypothetical protein BJ928_13128 [Rhizobium sp. WW_1]
MGICVANAHAEDAESIDHRHDFVVRGDNSSALSYQKSNNAAAVPKAAKRQLADHARMAK